MKKCVSVLLALAVSSCTTHKKKEAVNVEEVSFSVASVKSPNKDLTLVGSSPNCSIKWVVSQKILTHRMNCETLTQDELWIYLLGMASKLKHVSKEPIYFVRYTSADFPKEERSLGRAFSSSKTWKKLNNQNIKKPKYKDFSNRFLAKVIEKKGVLSMVPKALNKFGYSFAVDQVEIKDYKMQKNRVLRPVGTKVVFKNQRLPLKKNL
jgi:hypothetical protein